MLQCQRGLVMDDFGTTFHSFVIRKKDRCLVSNPGNMTLISIYHIRTGPDNKVIPIFPSPHLLEVMSRIPHLLPWMLLPWGFTLLKYSNTNGMYSSYPPYHIYVCIIYVCIYIISICSSAINSAWGIFCECLKQDVTALS